MEQNNLRAANVARDQEWNTGSERLSLTFRATELAGEVGEACNVIKKLERERIGLVGSRDTKEHLAEELADIVICTDLVAMDAGIDLDAAIAAKFNATSEKNGLATRLSIPVPATTFPLEATPAMVKAALDLVWEESESHDDLVCRLWRAMAAVAPDQTNAARDVLAERRRQMDAEGWTTEHDDQHSNGEMARAASCYITNRERTHLPTIPLKWPWSDTWWKPDGYRRNLVKAGALILAEIERLDRATENVAQEAQP